MEANLLYIDPGSGSYLVQMIIAAVLGSLFYVKTIWKRIKLFFTKNKDASQNESADE
ncbi:MAG: hypothetical protein M3Z92_12830 [Bacteroidota bacterium]|nr:hypothetical protein [Bacteroidota bacterium]